MAIIVVDISREDIEERIRKAKETDGLISIEWSQLSALARGFFAHDTIKKQLKESGVDTLTGGAEHAVSRLIGEHNALQAFSKWTEGLGVVPAELHQQLQQGYDALSKLYQQWVTWARDQNDVHEGAAPRTDSALRRGIEEKLNRG